MSSSSANYFNDSELSSPWGEQDCFSKDFGSSSSASSTLSHHQSGVSDDNSATPNSPTISKTGKKIYGDIRQDFKSGKVVAHTSYVDNINIAKHQRNFMSDSGVYQFKQAQAADDSPEFPLPIAGYKLGEKISANQITFPVFSATHETTGQAVLIKVSSDITHSDNVARFLNDWYITSGVNPPSSGYQTWLYDAGSPDSALPKHDISNSTFRPITLPRDIPGILYPIDQLSIVQSVNGTLTTMLLMIYPNENYKTLLEYYTEQATDNSVSLKVPDSVSSGPSDKSIIESASFVSYTSSSRSAVSDQDFDDLSNRVKQLQKTPDLVLKILKDFVPVLKALSSCHKHGIVHNGLTTSNILRSTSTSGVPEGKEVVLSGWDFCFSVAVEHSFNSFRNKNYNNMQQGLQFVSPENTSGATTSVDYRTDIYSIGVCLYETIVGCLPFQTSNLNELKRIILTHVPIRPKLLGSSWISSKLDNLIMKCVKKNPSDRYQSIDSLLKDLNDVISDYSKSKVHLVDLQQIREENVEEHEEVTNDERIEATAPQTLPLFHNSIRNSVRSKNDQVMQELIDRYHSPDRCKFLLVKGDCGVGKRTLLEQLRGEAVRKQDFFIHWSFDCCDRNVARYAFLIYGVYTTIKQILSSSRGVIEEWRKIFTYEIDADLSVLFQSIPNLKILLGPNYQSYRQNRPSIPVVQPKSSIQPSDTVVAFISEDVNDSDTGTIPSKKSEEFPYEEDKLNMELKYNYIFKQIFSIIARGGLTIILDNINWLPNSEFNLLVEIFEFCEINTTNAAVSIVGSYQTSNVLSPHENSGVDPIQYQKVADALKWSLTDYELKNLDKDAFFQYFECFFEKKNKEYSDAVYKRVKGNFLAFEYFMRCCLLKCNNHSNLLEQSLEDSRNYEGSGGIIKEYLNVAINAEALRLLKFATIICSNGSFDICELMIVTGYPLKTVHSLLQLCLNTRLIVSLGICYKVPFHMITENSLPFELNDSIILEVTRKARYRFDHSTIQLHILKEMEDNNEFQELHRICGLRFQKHLLKTTKVNIIAYLNMASHLLLSCDVARPEDHKAYHEAMINGGRYAISTSNLPLAIQFFDASVKFINKNDRQSKLKLALSRIQCNYYMGNFDKANQILREAETEFGHNNWTLLHLSVCSLFSSKQYKKGLKEALRGLKYLKIEYSLDPVEAKRLAEKHMNSLPLSLAEIRSLKTLDKAWDKRFILIAELVTTIMNVTFILELPDLRMAILAQLVNLMSTYGYTASCCIPLLHLANYFVQLPEDINYVKACEIADVAMTLVNNDAAVSTQSLQTINETYLLFMAQFKTPLPRILKRLAYVSLPSAVQSKNSFVKLWIMSSQLFLGNMRGWHSSSVGLGRSVRYNNDLEYYFHYNLMGLWCDKLSLEDYMSLSTKFADKLTPDLEFVYYANALLYASHEERYMMSPDLIMNKTYKISKKLPLSALHVLYYFLSVITLVHVEDAENKPDLLEIVKEIRERFKLWSEHSPAIFLCEHKIIEATHKTMDPSFPSLALLDLFEDAVEESEKQKKWLQAGIVCRICAKWLQRQSHSERRVHFYVRKAYQYFSTVMATKKMESLKADFPASFNDFNWAGVPNVGEPSPPVQQNIFDERFYTDNAINYDENDLMNESIVSSKAEKEAAFKKKIQPPSQGEWTKTLKLCLFIAQSSSIDLIVQKLLESCLMFSGVDYGVVVFKMSSQQPVIKAIGSVDSVYMLDNISLIMRPDLSPSSMIIQALLDGNTVHSHGNGYTSDDPYFIDNPNSTGFCVPIKTSTIVGAIYLESKGVGKTNNSQALSVDSAVIDLLSLLCSQAAVSFTKSVVYNQMEVAKRAAEDATEEKASFLANMSHEIRTPFNSLFACSIFLLDTELSNIQREYVETIKNSALVTLNIIDGILAFTKIEHGSFNLENAPFSINDTIESAIVFASEQTESEHLEFAYFNNCPELETIHGDATRIRQIIINLVGNALKFTSVGHVKVTLEATHIKDSRYEFSLSVEDTGIGIPTESASKIFGAFTQVDGSSRRVYGGSGLGLAISKKLAEIMNGRITFTSKENSGSTFVFSCPFEVEPPVKKMECDTQNVVIVSKKMWKRLALKQVLEYYNANVNTFEKASSLESYNYPVDVLVIGRECLEEAEYALTLPRWKNVRLYILTRFGQMVSDLELKKLNPCGILFSPIKRSSVKGILFDPPSVSSTLQRKPTKLTLPTTSAEEKSSANNLSILIAEDNMVNLVVASRHLKKLGYVADHAKDGVEVLEKCEARLKEGKKYDVIFMDIQMPKKDGIQATIDLKNSLSKRGLDGFFPKIIALTANVACEERDRCLEAGMVDFVSKPILPELLKKALAKVKEDL